MRRPLLCLFFVLTVFAQVTLSQPLLEWSTIYAWEGNSNDEPVEMVLSDSGNIYIGGTCSEDGAANFLTLKYYPDGSLAWDAIYAGSMDLHDRIRAIAVDQWGNAIVTGYHNNAPLLQKCYTVKYANSDGHAIWAADDSTEFGPSGNNAFDIAVDSSGHAYITGFIYTELTGFDWLSIGYTSLGEEMWKAQYNGPDSTGDRAAAIAVSPGGDVYVAGEIRSEEQYLLRTSKLGTPGWGINHSLNTYGSITPDCPLIALSENEDVYVSTFVDFPEENRDALLIKYDSGGNFLWESLYNGPDDLEDDPVDLALDNDGNILLLCYSRAAGNARDMALIKYNSDGDTLWTSRYEAYNTDAKALAIDEENNIYVLGNVGGYVIVKYDAGGSEQWVEYYWDASLAVDIAVDAQNNIYVTGYGSFAGTSLDVVTLKYSQETGIEDDGLTTYPQTFTLHGAYPNPFNPTTMIGFDLPVAAQVELNVFDIHGCNVTGHQPLATSHRYNPGYHTFPFDGSGLPSGIYIYRLVAKHSLSGTAGDYTGMGKMVLMK